MTASSKAAVIGERLGKSYADSCAQGCRHSDKKSVPALSGCKCGGKQGRERRNRAVHQSRQAGLYDLEHEQTPPGVIFFPAGVGLKFLVHEFLGAMRVGTFLLRQRIE
jgi:hypothetical protein